MPKRHLSLVPAFDFLLYLSSLLSSSLKRLCSSSFSRMSSHCLRYCARGLSGKEVWRAFTPPSRAPPWGGRKHQGQSQINLHKSKDTPGTTDLRWESPDLYVLVLGITIMKPLQISLSFLLQGSGWSLCRKPQVTGESMNFPKFAEEAKYWDLLLLIYRQRQGQELPLF